MSSTIRYDGKGSNYVAGKNVVNKEGLLSKFLVGPDFATFKPVSFVNCSIQLAILMYLFM